MIYKLIKEAGYTTVSEGWHAQIETWLSWYKGKTAFHKYDVYNGKTRVACERKSLGMAKQLCEDKADLLLNEKVEIFCEHKERLDELLENNSFRTRASELIELVAATGTGAMTQYLDGTDICMDFHSAESIYPLKWRNRQITECLFVSKEGDDYWLQWHLQDGDGYIVKNQLVDEDGNSKPTDLLPEWKTEQPMFQIIKLNIANNIEPKNPMGMSVFANDIDKLKAVDIIYDSFVNEFDLGRKRIFVDSTLTHIDIDSDGIANPVFDRNDIVFYGVPELEGQKPITESNMELRIEEHLRGIQLQLDLLADSAGFGKGFYSFEGDGVKTATEVISQNSKLYKKKQKDEIILRAALIKMARAVLSLDNLKAGEVTIAFDDSIIEDTDALARRAMQEYNAGIIDRIEYYKRVYGLTEDAAKTMDQEIKTRTPEPPEVDWFA